MRWISFVTIVLVYAMFALMKCSRVLLLAYDLLSGIRFCWCPVFFLFLVAGRVPPRQEHCRLVLCVTFKLFVFIYIIAQTSWAQSLGSHRILCLPLPEGGLMQFLGHSKRADVLCLLRFDLVPRRAPRCLVQSLELIFRNTWQEGTCLPSVACDLEVGTAISFKRVLMCTRSCCNSLVVN